MTKQRSENKYIITFIVGLDDEIEFKKLVRHFKKSCSCNGTLINDETFGQVIQLQGDHRKAVAKLLVEDGLASKKQIKIHDF